MRAFVTQTVGISVAQAAISVMQTAAMYLYFSYQVSAGRISIADYIVLLGAATLFASILLGFFRQTAQIRKTLAYTNLFRQYRAHVREHSSIFASNRLPMPELDLANLCITFENVSFTYPGRKHPVLEQISFTIRAGECVGIVGLNGSGKTTLIKLLCRLYDPDEGRILLNGVDIKTIPHDAYTRLIGIVLQDFFLFAYPVRENIAFDAAVDMERLETCLRQSGLTEKIASLPNGTEHTVYKTLDASGVEFSGGEGQKLALARALYKDARILILDEPTSAMDPLAEHALFSRLSELSKGRTTLFISHRLSSTVFCDRILVLADGRIAEIGNHKELMRKNGLYAQLFNAQARHYALENPT